MLHALMHVSTQMPIDEMTFPELDALRGELRLPQTKLCQRIDLNPATYTRWRRWARGMPGGAKPQSRSLNAVREALKRECERRHERPLVVTVVHPSP